MPTSRNRSIAGRRSLCATTRGAQRAHEEDAGDGRNSPSSRLRLWRRRRSDFYFPVFESVFESVFEPVFDRCPVSRERRALALC